MFVHPFSHGLCVCNHKIKGEKSAQTQRKNLVEKPEGMKRCGVHFVLWVKCETWYNHKCPFINDIHLFNVVRPSKRICNFMNLLLHFESISQTYQDWVEWRFLDVSISNAMKSYTNFVAISLKHLSNLISLWNDTKCVNVLIVRFFFLPLAIIDYDSTRYFLSFVLFIVVVW